MFGCDHGDDALSVALCDRGWAVAYSTATGVHRVLTTRLTDIPLLFQTRAIAARVADACFPNPEHKYWLAWRTEFDGLLLSRTFLFSSKAEHYLDESYIGDG